MTDAQILILTQEIAKHLDGWEYQSPRDEMDQNIGYLVRDEMKISVKRDWQKKDRVNIHTWSWPTYTENPNGRGPNSKRLSPSDLYEPRESSPSISVAIERGAEIIAREISRRFLPHYERIFARLAEKAQEFQKYSNETRDNWTQVCAVLHKTPSHALHYVDIGSAHLTIQQNGKQAKIEFYATPAQLAAVVAALKGVK